MVTNSAQYLSPTKKQKIFSIWVRRRQRAQCLELVHNVGKNPQECKRWSVCNSHWKAKNLASYALSFYNSATGSRSKYCNSRRKSKLCRPLHDDARGLHQRTWHSCSSFFSCFSMIYLERLRSQQKQHCQMTLRLRHCACKKTAQQRRSTISRRFILS